MSVERKIEKMVAALNDVPELGARVYPVIVPARAREWPALVYSLAGGQQVDTTRGSAVMQGVMLNVVGDRYADVMKGMTAALRKLASQEGMFFTWPPPRTDGAYDDELKLFSQGVHLILGQ